MGTTDTSGLFGEVKTVVAGKRGGIDPIVFPEIKETIYFSSYMPGKASWFYFSHNTPNVIGEWQFAFTDAKSIRDIHSLMNITFCGEGSSKIQVNSVRRPMSGLKLSVEAGNPNSSDFTLTWKEDFSPRSVVAYVGEVFVARRVGVPQPVIALKYLNNQPVPRTEGIITLEYAFQNT